MTGRAFVFGDDIDTDALAPGHLMKLPPEELARHCLVTVDPGFASSVRPGDFVVAGRNFGLGSSREQAAVSLKRLGVAAVVAVSFARIFFRNAINLGLPVYTFVDAATIRAADRLRIDAASGVLENITRHTFHRVPVLPAHLRALIDDGGLMPHLEKKLAIARRSQGDST